MHCNNSLAASSHSKFSTSAEERAIHVMCRGRGKSRLINGVVTTGTGRAEKKEEPDNGKWPGEVE